MAKYLTKGDTLLIEGRLQKRMYEINGEKKYISEIICEKVKLIKKKEVKEPSLKDFADKVEERQGAYTKEDISNDIEDNSLPFY